MILRDHDFITRHHVWGGAAGDNTTKTRSRRRRVNTRGDFSFSSRNPRDPIVFSTNVYYYLFLSVRRDVAVLYICVKKPTLAAAVPIITSRIKQKKKKRDRTAVRRRRRRRC